MNLCDICARRYTDKAIDVEKPPRVWCNQPTGHDHAYVLCEPPELPCKAFILDAERITGAECVYELMAVDIGGGKSYCTLIDKWTNCREVGHCTADNGKRFLADWINGGGANE